MVPFLILLSLAAFYATYRLGMRIRTSRAARNWPQHPATILESTVSRQRIKHGILYKITVRYEYTLGHRRTLTEVLPSPFGTDRESVAQSLATFFQVGSTVPVHVDPQRPDLALLHPDIDEGVWTRFGLTLSFGVGTLVAIFWV
ncbi:MAG: DUF3592 domain-containing protein [Verrucomicrobia bacterium]|nr:DUF3592 domain-containing protein [Verrucomicrobiota bacterium]